MLTSRTSRGRTRSAVAGAAIAALGLSLMGPGAAFAAPADVAPAAALAPATDTAVGPRAGTDIGWDGLSYSVTIASQGQSYATVTGFDGDMRPADGHLDIPAAMTVLPGHAVPAGEYPVTEIAAEAFYDPHSYTNPGIPKVTIGANVTVIGAHAFRETDVHELVFAEGSKLEVIEGHAFEDGRLQGTLTLPPTVHTLGTSAFRDNHFLDAMTFTNPDPLSMSITGDNLAYNRNLTAINVPAELENGYREALNFLGEDLTLIKPVGPATAALHGASALDPEFRVSAKTTPATKEIWVTSNLISGALPKDVTLGFGFSGASITGGTVWHDAQITDGQKVTVTSEDGSTTDTWTIRIGHPQPPVQRFSGKSRLETSCAVTEKALERYSEGGETVDTVFISSGYSSADSGLAGAAAASLRRSAAMTVGRDLLPDCTKDTIERIVPTTINIVGGHGVVSRAVEQELKELAPNADVTRFGGTTRLDTAKQLNDYVVTKSTVSAIVVANAYSDTDMVTAASLAASINALVYTVPHGQKTVPAGLRDLIFGEDIHRTFIVGGNGVVPARLEQALFNMGTSADRIGGIDRFATSARVARSMKNDNTGFPEMMVANGRNVADGNAGVAYATVLGPTLLTESACLPSSVHSVVWGGVPALNFLGGHNAISSEVERKMHSCEAPAAARMADADGLDPEVSTRVQELVADNAAR